jgi:hypothetical protein
MAMPRLKSVRRDAERGGRGDRAPQEMSVAAVYDRRLDFGKSPGCHR